MTKTKLLRPAVVLIQHRAIPAAQEAHVQK